MLPRRTRKQLTKQPMTKQAFIPVFCKFSELDINPIFSGRSEKEIRDNAKILAKEMEAHGEWDSMQPGQVVTVPDSKPRVCAGFTRIEAAKSLGYKGGWFFKVADSDETAIRLKCITTNGGKPVSRLEQGRLFASLETGIVADDFAGATADPKNAKDWRVRPLDADEIAGKIGKSAEHVRQCVAVFNFPEAVELIESEQASHNITTMALNWAKGDHGNAMRILRAAVKAASGDRATKKHMDLIKAKFVQQKAVTPKKEKNKEDASPGNERERDEESSAGSESEEKEDASQEENQPELIPPAPQAPAPHRATKKEQKGIRDTLIASVAKFDQEKGTNQMEDTEIEGLADWLIDAGLIVAALPF